MSEFSFFVYYRFTTLFGHPLTNKIAKWDYSKELNTNMPLLLFHRTAATVKITLLDVKLSYF